MKYKLGDICEIVSGSTPKTSVEEYWDGDIKWITPAELTDDSYIIDDTARKLTELGVKKTGLTPFPAGTVILSSRAPIGKVAIAGCEMYCNQGFKNLICSDKINNKYLYWFLKGNTAFLNSLGRGATFKEISKGIVGNIEINVPDVADQEKAVVNLEKLSEIIKLRKSELEEFDNLIKARFVELFGDPMINNKGFELRKYGELFELNAGGTPSKAKPEYWNGGTISWIGSNMCQNAYIYENDGNYITEEGMAHSSARMFPVDTVLVALVGATIGKTALLKFETTTNQNVLGIRKIRENGYLPEFIFYYTQGLYQKFLNIGDGGFAMASKGFISELPLPVVDIHLQEEFSMFAEQVDKSKVAVQKSLDETQKLFDSLMQEYFG
ncbi:restriction endonuclease subunit S [Butyrivibrio sp. WCD3002]|uniref:restriction endonuclease subunit S n=1 Tax=Butyrivibrio sp. WCD3002 TaxID=1280676 RepID=UPI00042655F6|nr:restriction endonuclease subunit S [Butyrivibrio sp. WCD3002]